MSGGDAAELNKVFFLERRSEKFSPLRMTTAWTKTSPSRSTAHRRREISRGPTSSSPKYSYGKEKGQKGPSSLLCCPRPDAGTRPSEREREELWRLLFLFCTSFIVPSPRYRPPPPSLLRPLTLLFVLLLHRRQCQNAILKDINSG